MLLHPAVAKRTAIAKRARSVKVASALPHRQHPVKPVSNAKAENAASTACVPPHVPKTANAKSGANVYKASVCIRVPSVPKIANASEVKNAYKDTVG